jgi:hypothetical protein
MLRSRHRDHDLIIDVCRCPWSAIAVKVDITAVRNYHLSAWSGLFLYNDCTLLRYHRVLI